jgi:uncharacterized protein DUF6011
MPQTRGRRAAIVLDAAEARRFYERLKREGARDRWLELGPPVAGEMVYSVSTPSTERGNSFHYQFVRVGRKIKVFNHLEPDSLADPLRHAGSMTDGSDVSWGLGAAAARRNYRAGTQTASCSRCGRALWGQASIRRGMGPWCAARAA